MNNNNNNNNNNKNDNDNKNRVWVVTVSPDGMLDAIEFCLKKRRTMRKMHKALGENSIRDILGNEKYSKISYGYVKRKLNKQHVMMCVQEKRKRRESYEEEEDTDNNIPIKYMKYDYDDSIGIDKENNRQDQHTEAVHNTLESIAKKHTSSRIIDKDVIRHGILPYLKLHSKRFGAPTNAVQNGPELSETILNISKDFRDAGLDKYAEDVMEDTNYIAYEIAKPSNTRIDIDTPAKVLQTGGVRYPSSVINDKEFFKRLLGSCYDFQPVRRITNIDENPNIKIIMDYAVETFNSDENVMKYVACFRNGEYIHRVSQTLQKNINFISSVIDYASSRDTYIRPRYIHRSLYEYDAIVNYANDQGSNNIVQQNEDVVFLKSLGIPKITSRILFNEYQWDFKECPWDVREVFFSREEMVEALKTHPSMYEDLVLLNKFIPEETRAMLRTSDFISEVAKLNPEILRYLNVRYDPTTRDWVEIYKAMRIDQYSLIPMKVKQKILNMDNNTLKLKYEKIN